MTGTTMTARRAYIAAREVYIDSIAAARAAYDEAMALRDPADFFAASAAYDRRATAREQRAAEYERAEAAYFAAADEAAK